MTQRFAIIAWLLVTLLLSGCGTSRHLSKSNTQGKVETAEAVQSGTEEKTAEAVTVKTDVAQDEETITEVTEFDTSLPVDPATGTPPVKKKTTQTKRTATQVQQAVEADCSTSAGSFQNKESFGKSDTVTTTEDTTRRGLNWMQSALCMAGIAAILTLIVWALVRRFKRH